MLIASVIYILKHISYHSTLGIYMKHEFELASIHTQFQVINRKGFWLPSVTQGVSR